MALVNLTTNFRSLKFGGDRPGGGSSKQPFIKNPIPSNWNDSGPSNVFNTGGDDNFVRGGLITPLRVADDTSRLTQLFFTTTKGTLFTAKQNLLSRISVETEASKGPGYAGKALNQGVYTPLSTLGQAASGFSGTHLNTFGLDPSSPIAGVVDGGLFPSFGLNRYEKAVRENNILGKNRLEKYLNDYINNKNNNPFFPEQNGGPGSILGIGKTKIPLSTQRTGVNSDNFPFQGVNNPLYFDIKNFQNNRQDRRNPDIKDNLISPLRSTNYNKLLNSDIEININSDSGYWVNNDAKNVYNPDTLNSNTNLKDQSGWNGTTTMKQEDFESFKQEDLFPQTKQIRDFRENLEAPTNKKVLGKLNKGFYTSKNIENRVNLGDPGKTKDVTKYGGKVSFKDAVDKITASSIYQATNANHTGEKNDLAKFSIGIIQNNSTGNSWFMHFRAFINSFSDAYNAEWGNTQYVGRADKFYNYKGFDRAINMGFTVAAQSKAELIPMYKKLNFLASSLAPSYSEGGFMQGNLVRLTVGGYLYNQIGILKGLTYEIPSESPWEIAIDDAGGSDSNVKELPHIINVTGFSFIPIQDFVPRLSNPQDQFNTRYIQLANGGNRSNTNY